MKTLADWCPKGEVALVSLEILVAITVMLVLTWATAQILAGRRAALRRVLWLSALVGVLLTPALVVFGRHLPWRVGMLAPVASAPVRAEPAAAPAAGPDASQPPSGTPAAAKVMSL